jgi:hypothetical protein
MGRHESLDDDQPTTWLPHVFAHDDGVHAGLDLDDDRIRAPRIWPWILTGALILLAIGLLTLAMSQQSASAPHVGHALTVQTPDAGAAPTVTTTETTTERQSVPGPTVTRTETAPAVPGPTVTVTEFPRGVVRPGPTVTVTVTSTATVMCDSPKCYRHT